LDANDLHYILDEWFEDVVKPRMKGEALGAWQK
jgi:hypothetical protein